MAVTYQDAASQVQTIKHQLAARLDDSTSSLADLSLLVAEFRSASESAVLADIAESTSSNIEEQLWTGHQRVNERFRKLLGQKEARRKAVEHRKLVKAYIEFIKASQLFYRGLVYKLNSRFGGIQELQLVAHKLTREDLETPVQSSPSMHRREVLQLCYNALIRLGDLSRYREKAQPNHEPDWSHAIGYYELAGAINPYDGTAHNQRAVISLANSDPLRACYHLYRALSVDHPHPMASGNLEIQFKKIASAWERGERISNDIGGGRSIKVLTAWFLRLHSKCYAGKDFNGRSELEDEVTGQLIAELKGRSLEGILLKFVIINIAAEWYAGVRLFKEESRRTENLQSYFYFLRVNLKTFAALLRLFQRELGTVVGDTDADSIMAGRITAVSRRLLPGLRIYSLWLLVNFQNLTPGFGDDTVQSCIGNIWEAYSSCLTVLSRAFTPANALPVLDYQLEEDVDTNGFKPLWCERTRPVWHLNGEAQMERGKFSDPNINRHHPNDEMLFRIRGLLVDGLQLVVDQKAPILLEGSRFIHTAKPVSTMQNQATISSNGVIDVGGADVQTPLSDESIDHVSIGIDQGGTTTPPSQECIHPPVLGLATDKQKHMPSEADQEAEMSRMVDNLLGDDFAPDELEENLPPTPPAQTFEDTTLINEAIYGLGNPTADSLSRTVHAQATPKLSIPKFTAFAPGPVLSDSVWSPDGWGTTTLPVPPGLPSHLSPLSSPVPQMVSVLGSERGTQSPLSNMSLSRSHYSIGRRPQVVASQTTIIPSSVTAGTQAASKVVSDGTNCQAQLDCRNALVETVVQTADNPYASGSRGSMRSDVLFGHSGTSSGTLSEGYHARRIPPNGQAG